MIFMIFVGADMLNSALALTQMPARVADLVTHLDVPPLLVVAAILVFYIVLGGVMDELSMLLLTLPVLMPAVMSLDLLGEGFDLHCGGMDLKFPHHENERAQAVALGKRFANHWMHHGFVVDGEGEKMSKSLGNVANLLDLMEHYDPRAYRMLLLQSHYRGPVAVNQANIDASVAALAGLDSFAARTAALAAAGAAPDADVLDRFRTQMDDDLDTPGATALLFDTVRRANAALDAGSSEAAGLAAAVNEICNAFGLVLNAGGEVPAEAAARAAALDAARAAKDFAGADALRAELQADGWIVETTKAGTSLRR
jgi:cysteinyl-tRNA synthetase